MKRFLKILGVGVLSLAIVFASCFIPMKMKQSETSLSKASAVNSSPNLGDIPNTALPDSSFVSSTDFFSSSVFLSLIATTNDSSITQLDDFSRLTTTSPNSIFNGSGTFPILNYSFGLSSNILSDARIIGFSMKAVYSSLTEYTEYINQPSYFTFGAFQLFNDVNVISEFDYNTNYVSSTRVSLYSNKEFHSYSFIGYSMFSSEILYKGQPNLDIVSVEILNSYEMLEYTGFSPDFSNSNIVLYTDSNGWKYAFYIPVPFDAFASPILLNSYYLNYRKYYFEAAFKFDDNDYYQQGVSDGFSDGYNQGESAGYKSGFNAGENEGFNAGYIEGLNTADEFTFFGLISAVVDAPLQTFSGLFDFDLLGVNLEKFFYALLTFCVVILIFKIALGGK